MDTEEFSIDERFDYLKSYITIIANGQMSSLIITGTTGIGKTHTVLTELKNTDKEIFVVKGFSTARALYDTLYIHRNVIIVFDDCDSILGDKVAINILKGALDSYDQRVISWLAKSTDKTIPLQFNFQGQVIFISNVPMKKLDLAMKSRALTIDLTMTYDEKIARMFDILVDIKPHMDYYQKKEALYSLLEHATDQETVNLRTLEQAMIIIDNFPNNYDNAIKFMLSS